MNGLQKVLFWLGRLGPTLLLLGMFLTEESKNHFLQAAEQPNLIFILADDLGWGDVAFHGSEIQTPNLDRLVQEGAELERFYVCPVCSPTRAGLMTGRYPIRFGLMRAVLPPWREGGLDPQETTLAEKLADAGYRHRGVFGKWHLGHSSRMYHPLEQGFTEFLGHYNGAIDYFTHEREGEQDWHRGFEPLSQKGYTTDLIARASADFIKRNHQDGPFFCYIPFNAPHSPLQAKKKDLAKYKDLGPPQASSGKKVRQDRKTLAAMIDSMDQGIGLILQTLDELDLAENTVVWFSSDNGGVDRVAVNRPYRGHKSTVFEGGIRVPAVVRWPAKIPAGKKIDAPLGYIDVFPTMVEMAGIAKKTAPSGRPLDGISAYDLLLGEATPGERGFYSYIGQSGEEKEQIALHEGDWKLVCIGQRLDDLDAQDSQREFFLFDIKKDPYEETNLASKHPEVVQKMLTKLILFRQSQPADAVPPYNVGKVRSFQAPKNWQIPAN
ncbi:N-acetylgalactosamine-6-sulfate sulfatase [Planctomycetales bacterium 10988]|nr:N-acetylgalactosamine-6-sulfate sulfatase [Planctomycetales bacterium 10988]